MNKHKYILPLFLLGLLFSSTGLALDEQGKVIISDTVLQDMDGKRKLLSDYTGKGKWTVVMLWASDCHVCNQEASEYDDFHHSHRDRDAVMLGISMDGIEGRRDAMSFIERNDVGFPNLIGDPEAVASLYIGLTGSDWIGTPSFLIFAPDGELKAAQAGAVPVSIINEFIQQNTQNN